MIRALSSILALALASPGLSQTTDLPAFVSPCPKVFMYEPPGTEPGKWYGVITLNTDITLHALWLNVVLDSKADILGNWVGEVTTEDNFDFKIENTKMKIVPGEPLSVRFFIQYNSLNPFPLLKAIRFNGREICNVENSQDQEIGLTVVSDNNYEIYFTTNDTNSTTVKPQLTTLKSQRWQTEKVNNTQQPTTINSIYWTPTNTINLYTEKTTNDARQYLTPTQSPFYNYSIYSPPQTKTFNNRVSNKTLAVVTETFQSYYTYSPQSEETTTTLKPKTWFQEKSDNTQRISSGNKVIEPQSSASKVQSPPQLWATPNQQIKTKDKQQTSQTKFPPWSQVKVGNKQQGTTQDKNDKVGEYNQETIQIKNDSQLQPAETGPVNENRSDTEKNILSHYWPKISVDDNIEVIPIKHVAPGNEPGRFQTKFVVDDTERVQLANSQNKFSDSTSFIRSENSERVKPDSRSDSKSYDYQGLRESPSTISQDQNIKSGSRSASKSYEKVRDSPSTIIEDQDEPKANIPIYVRPEDKQTVTKVILGTTSKDNLQTVNKGINQNLSGNRKDLRPVDVYKKKAENEQQNRDDESIDKRPIKRTGDKSEVRTASWSEGSPGPYKGQSNREGGIETFGDLIKFRESDETKDRGTFNTPAMADFDDIDLPKKEEDIEYYFGGGPTIYIRNHGPSRPEPTCGRVLMNELLVNNPPGIFTLEGQWPWQIALYQQQTTVDFKYICGGTLVSRRHIITAAHCVTRKGSRRVVNKNTLTVYLGKHNLRTFSEGVQVRFVSRIVVHPEYNATNFGRDLAILELREPVTYSNWIQPACLWPENETDLKYIVGEKGSVVGWGFEANGVAKEELSLLEMPVVDQRVCLKSAPDFYRRFISDYTYCAGYREGTIVCNGDSGGGMVFKKGNNWYLRGLASLSVAQQGQNLCDPNHYVVFTDIAQFLPWIEENVDDY